MLESVAMLLLLADAPRDQPTPPRYRDAPATQPQTEAPRSGDTTDPLFTREIAATDDPAFILTAVENSRQGVIDARAAADKLEKPDLRAAAEKIGAQQEATTRQLEKIAQAKGWRLPQPNPGRTAAPTETGVTRANANFILNQISVHENTVAQFEAQLAGKGDADLKRTLRQSLPGYRRNLEMLLTLKP